MHGDICHDGFGSPKNPSQQLRRPPPDPGDGMAAFDSLHASDPGGGMAAFDHEPKNPPTQKRTHTGRTPDRRRTPVRIFNRPYLAYFDRPLTIIQHKVVSQLFAPCGDNDICVLTTVCLTGIRNVPNEEPPGCLSLVGRGAWGAG